jgi:opacity protein-like surface antigen
MGQFRSIIIGLALVMGQTAGAAAADLGLLPPPPIEVTPCVGCAGPWYIRGFVGGANPHVGDISSELFQFNDFQVFHKDIKSSPFVGGGVGYEFNQWLRFDVTGEYRGDATFFGQDRYPGSDGFNRVGPPFGPGEFNPGTNEYTADIQSWLGLANAYVNLGTYHCLTPYVGGGVGFASISVNGLKDVNVPNGSVFYGADHTQTNFAWGVYAGLAYDVTPGLTIDLSYRYTDLGDARSGRVTAYDDSSSYKSLNIDDITSNDIMLGVRWKLGSQPAPMPVAFK